VFGLSCNPNLTVATNERRCANRIRAFPAGGSRPARTEQAATTRSLARWMCWQKYNNSAGSWNRVNSRQVQPEARQQTQTYQPHANSQADVQQREQSFQSAACFRQLVFPESQFRDAEPTEACSQSERVQQFRRSGGGSSAHEALADRSARRGRAAPTKGSKLTGRAPGRRLRRRFVAPSRSYSATRSWCRTPFESSRPRHSGLPTRAPSPAYTATASG